jgi:hypothetical protein
MCAFLMDYEAWGPGLAVKKPTMTNARFVWDSGQGNLHKQDADINFTPRASDNILEPIAQCRVLFVGVT